MTAPRLNRHLVLEDPQRIDDGSGGFVETWTALGDLWAEVAPLTGRRHARDGRLQMIQRYRITVRAAPVGAAGRPRPDQRFREGGRLFRIHAVAEADALGRYLSCFAQEEVSA